MRSGFVCVALVAAIGVCVPATAAQQLIIFTGLAGVSPSGTPIAALQQFAGATVVGAFLVDTAAVDSSSMEALEMSRPVRSVTMV